MYYCDGKWTNIKCNSEPSKTLTSPSKTTRDPIAAQLSKRKLWLHDLEMLRIKAKREHDVSVSTQSVRDACLSMKNDESTCRNLIDDKEKELNKLILSYKKLEIEKEVKEVESEEKPVKTQQQVIVIREDRRYLRRRHHQTHPHGHGTTTQAGAGISVSTTNSSGSTTISGSAGIQSTERKSTSNTFIKNP